MASRLTSLSFDDLVALRDNVIRIISTKATATRRELEAKLATLNGLGLTLGIGGGAKRGPKPRGSKLKGRKVPAKYRNPKNHAETWAGRGATPRWLRAELKGGRKLDDFAITKAARKAKR
jgi:DNA-binding protein H-NS